MALYMKQASTRERALPMSNAEWDARVQLAAAYRIFDHLGWTEMIFNHISLRVPGDERIFLINPFGLHYSEVKASNLVAIDIDGNPVRETLWPVNRAGFVPHSTLHANIEDAHCVMHTHTTSGLAVACLERGLAHDSFYGAQLYGQVAYHEFEGVTVNPGEGARMLASIGDKRAVILRNHGLLAWAPTLPEAFMTLWTLQRACDVQVAAASLGPLNPIRPSVFEQTARDRGTGEKQVYDMLFASLVRAIEARDPGYKT